MLTDALRGFLQAGILIGGCGLVMLFMLPRDSAEFVLSLCSALMGGFLVVAVILLKVWANRLPRMQEDKDGDDLG
ncbi:MAG: hypothetical protein IT323_01195 [Anaerolineae bacterium]|nr:hypothetical protein [Anaerolineae bacterium]